MKKSMRLFVRQLSQLLILGLLFVFIPVSSNQNQFNCSWDFIGQTIVERLYIDQIIRKEMRKTANPQHELLLVGANHDQENTKWLKEVVNFCGWPKKRDVGEFAAFGAWVIAQHSDKDLIFQKQAIRAMEGAALNGEADTELYEKLLNRYNSNIAKINQSSATNTISDEQSID